MCVHFAVLWPFYLSLSPPKHNLSTFGKEIATTEKLSLAAKYSIYKKVLNYKRRERERVRGGFLTIIHPGGGERGMKSFFFLTLRVTLPSFDRRKIVLIKTRRVKPQKTLLAMKTFYGQVGKREREREEGRKKKLFLLSFLPPRG